MSFLSTSARRFDAYWYFAAPADRLALLRIAIGSFALAYLVLRFPALTSVTRFSASAFHPVGPVSLLDAPLPAPVVYAQTALAVLLGAGFVLGYRYRFTAPVFACLLLWITSYRSSWGMKFHTENLFTLHVLLLSAAPAADALALGSRAGPAPVHGRYGWPIRALCLVTVATYVLAGVAKLRMTGLDWAGGEALRVHVAYDNLRKIELGSVHSPIGARLVSVPALFPILAASTLLLELGAPLALLHRRIAGVWVAGAWAFHLGVLALMAIVFPYPLSGVAYLPFFDLEKARDLRYTPRFLRKADVQ
jgi:hypothetical protein